MFRSTQGPSSGSSLVLSWNYLYGFMCTDVHYLYGFMCTDVHIKPYKQFQLCTKELPEDGPCVDRNMSECVM